MCGMKMKKERDKEAWGQAGQQEMTEAPCYDSFCFFLMPPSIQHNLKALGQTQRPGRPRETAVSQGTNSEGGRGKTKGTSCMSWL